MLYAKQHIFDFRDNPGKQLARVLASPMSSPAMIKVNGEPTRDVRGKLQMFLDYAKLFAPTDNQDSSKAFFQVFDALPQLREEHRIALEASLIAIELSTATDHLKPNKSPGLDGLPVEFYNKFKITLIPHLQKLLLGCLRDNEMPET